ncbi:hypothetical protein [Campylobacter lari]|uniref:XRE family transcriptional regulator n=1 Tax=Campylobacter lari NCTC 11845 TaxID=1388749 RepID=A0A0A8HUG3_CAMLA|nr:hypothetical protein [Campylobacter lari]AJD01358.1 hypothetical protein UPTC3659_0489 [Campylobacter lari NCTC 11845]EAK9955063.1 hypothetical protein [Campylobacter lari]MCR6543437.1 hypothetical protein [Campylobacter lari]
MVKKYFEDNNINLKKFAQKYDLDYMSLFRVVNGYYSEKYIAKANTKAVYQKLLELNIINELPDILK